MIRVLAASDVASCCRVKLPPDKIYANQIPFGNPNGDFPSPLQLSGGDGLMQPNCGNIVEGPIAMNGNDGCGPQVFTQMHCNHIVFQGNVDTSVPSGSGSKCNISASTSVTPVKVTNAPEPPQSQVVGRAVPATGQVPAAAILDPLHSNLATGLLIVGVVAIIAYFLTR